MNWIPLAQQKPDIGKTVITHHQLNRIDMLTYDGEYFNFPLTCPVTKDGEPMGWSSRYPARVITHWMQIPEAPNNRI